MHRKLINVGPAFILDYRVYLSVGKYWPIFDLSPLYCQHLLWMDPNLGDLIKNQNKKESSSLLLFFVFRNYLAENLEFTLLFHLESPNGQLRFLRPSLLCIENENWKNVRQLQKYVQVHLFPDLLAFWFLQKIKIDFCKWDCSNESTDKKKSPLKHT